MGRARSPRALPRLSELASSSQSRKGKAEKELRAAVQTRENQFALLSSDAHRRLTRARPHWARALPVPARFQMAHPCHARHQAIHPATLKLREGASSLIRAAAKTAIAIRERPLGLPTQRCHLAAQIKGRQLFRKAPVGASVLAGGP